MDLDRLKELIALLAESPIAELDVTEDGHRVRLVKGASQGSKPAPATPAGSSITLVQSPLFGICHLTPSPGAPPFIGVGDRIEAGQPLCTIEAMKVFHSVRAEQAGRVDAILVAPGQEVEAGTPLVRIVP